jgi:hypothetical protein
MGTNVIRAVVRNGRVELEEPIQLPDGTEVLIALPNVSPEPTDTADWSSAPQAVAAWLQWYDSLEPLLFTPEEEADTEAWLKKMNNYSMDSMDRPIADLFR